MRLRHANWLDDLSSGLVVVGTGPTGRALAKVLRDSNFIKSYEVRCKFGRATHNFFESGRTTEKRSYSRLTYERFRRLISSIVSANRSAVYRAMGVDMQSQDAYELAASGMVRPITYQTAPLLMDARCTYFDPPDFTIDIQTVNEEQVYVGALVHGLGLRSKTTACISSLKCTRYGYFKLDKALLQKQWTVEQVINNMTACRGLTTPDKIVPSSPTLHRIDVSKVTVSDMLTDGGGELHGLPPGLVQVSRCNKDGDC